MNWDVVGALISGVSGVIAIAAATWAIAVAFLLRRGRSPFIESALRRGRRVALGVALRRLGVSGALIRRAIRESVASAVASPDPISVQTEVEWLERIARASDAQWRGPLIVHGLTKDSSPQHQLHALSRAYALYASRLQGLALLATNPILAQHATIAQQTADYLHENAGFHPGGVVFENVTLERSGEHWLHLEFAFLRKFHHTRVRIDDVEIAHTRRRQVVPGTPSVRWSEDDPVTVDLVSAESDEVAAIVKQLQRPRSFDGVLPALEGWWLQADDASGHRRLVLHLSEMTYSTVLLRHYVADKGAGRSREQVMADTEPPLLTLSLLPITDDGYIVTVRRSQHVGIGASRLAPGVNGNLELRSRLGLAVDRNSYGMPDIRAALAREAIEELGIRLMPQHMEIVGLVRIQYAEEINTQVLLATCRIGMTRDELIEASRGADLTEGYWELDGDFLFLPVPTTAGEAELLLRSTFHSTHAVPHLAANMVALCAPLLSTDTTESSDLEQILRNLMTSRESRVPLEALGETAER